MICYFAVFKKFPTIGENFALQKSEDEFVECNKNENKLYPKTTEVILDELIGGERK